MAERSYIFKMDRPDYDEAAGFQKGPALIFILEIFFAAGVSIALTGAALFFLYGFFFQDTAPAFYEWIIKTIENGSISTYAVAVVFGAYFMAVSFSVILKSLTGLWSVRKLEAPAAYDDFASAFVADLNGIIALLGPDEEVVAGLETGRKAFSGYRVAAYCAYFSAASLAPALFISSLVYYNTGYIFNEWAAFTLIFVLPFIPHAFVRLYGPMKSYSVSLFVLTVLVTLLFIAVRSAFFFYYGWFAALALTYLSAHAIVFTLGVLRKNVTGCLLLTNKGLRLIDLRGPAPADVSGLFVPAEIKIRPSGDFEFWEFSPLGGGERFEAMTSGAEIDEFLDLLRSAAGAEPAVGRSNEKKRISHNFSSIVLTTLMPLVCAAAGAIFLTETAVKWAYLSAAASRADADGQLSGRLYDEKTEKACRAILRLYPDDPGALVALFQCLDPGDKIEERYELLKRLAAYQGKRLMPLENKVTRFINTNLETTKSAIALIKNGPAGWEPRGEGLARFRSGMARTVNFKYYDKRFAASPGSASFELLAASKLSPESPGPRLMLAWMFYASPVPLISNMADQAAAPEELFVSFEKYEIALLSKKKLPDAAEAIALLDLFGIANAKLSAAASLENNLDFKGFGLVMGGVLPKLLRDRIVAGYLSARFDKKPLAEWDAVFKQASKFKFMDKTPVAYGRNTNLSAQPGSVYKLLFDPPRNKSEFLAAFPEISGCLSRGEAYAAMSWKTLSGYPDGHLARVINPKYEIMDMLPEKIRDVIRKLK